MGGAGWSKTLQERDFGKCRKPHLATPEILSSVQSPHSTTEETGVGAKATCLRSHSVSLGEHDLEHGPVPVLIVVTFGSFCD